MITVDVHEDLDSVDSEEWERLAANGHSGVFSTRVWQQCWWSAWGRGRLLVLTARRAGETAMVAPFFVDGGMAFLVGSGGSDYLDVIGDTSDTDSAEALLGGLAELEPELLGVRLYHVLDSSSSGETWAKAAAARGWDAHDEGDLPAPRFVTNDPCEWDGLASKKSLVRHERALAKQGRLAVEHSCAAEAAMPWLDAFFDLHVRQWAGRTTPSLFEDERQRAFYRRLVAESPPWLRFTRVVLDDRLVAAHLGFSHDGVFMWYKPTYDVELARMSPGEVLMRHLLLRARDEGATVFDLGLGDEPFKSRFSNEVRNVRTWGFYPGHG